MRVAILTSEAVPFAKTGGLGDVAGALPKALRAAADVDASLVLPLYQQTDRALLREQIIDNLEVEWGGQRRRISVWYSEAAGAPAVLIDAPHYFARPNLYGYPDDHRRFAFFSRAALELLKRLGSPPDVVHGNDWQSGFAMAELHSRRVKPIQPKSAGSNAPWYARLWIDSSVRVRAKNGSEARRERSSATAKPLCQSLPCTTSGAEPSLLRSSSAAREKKAKRW